MRAMSIRASSASARSWAASCGVGGKLLGARVEAGVALLFDWENWWALEHSSGPSAGLKYLNEMQNYYDAFYEQNIQVDLVGMDADLSRYGLSLRRCCIWSSRVSRTS